MIRRPTINFLVDIFSFFLFVGMILTGFVIWWPLPPGTNRTHSLWGLSRHQWGDVHAWLSFFLVAMVVLHIVLHWKWLIAMIRSRATTAQLSEKQWTLAILGVVLSFLALFAVLASSTVKTFPDSCARNYFGPFGAVQARAEEPARTVRELFDAKCLECHGGKKPVSGVDLRNLENLQVGKKIWVVPTRSAESPLVSFLTDPPSSLKKRAKHVLSEQEILLLQAWIDAGAKN